MTIIDQGSGPPIVIVPGSQGRWEWMRPGVDALSKRCRVITFSLADEPTSGAGFDEAHGFDSYVRQVREALDACGVTSAVVCGVSYGGLVAAAFAACHPERTDGVVVVSAIPPSWRPDARTKFLIRAPRVFAPLFCFHSLRLFREIRAASTTLTAALAFAGWHLATVARYPFSPMRMARRVRLIDTMDLEEAVGRIALPAMIVTGEAGLDRVVPVWMTHEYSRLWPDASVARIARTGHLGLITKPNEFADVVGGFVLTLAARRDSRRQVVG